MPMTVLVADKFEQSGLDGLRAAGCEVVFQPDASGDTLVDALRSSAASVLVVRSTQVTEPMLDAGPLALIVRAGAGVNTIDLAAASRRGIYVSNCPGKNAVAVAELALGLMLALDRRIPDNVADLRAGHWNKKEYSKARGLHGRTLGLLGFGSIGQEVARRAKAFGLAVQVWSRRFASDAAERQRAIEAFGIEVVDTPEALIAGADIISVHLALGKETRGFVNAARLAHIRPGAFFINTARGEVVDAAALEDAARTKSLRLGLDVFASEPATATGAFTDPLMALPVVYGTHHIGASTGSGAGSHCRRNRTHRPHVQGDRPRAQRGQSRAQDTRHPHAGGAPPRPARRAGPCLRPAASGAPERAGDRKHHLRRRARRRGPHQPGRCPFWRHLCGHSHGSRRHPRRAAGGALAGTRPITRQRHAPTRIK
jgi:D-3-phosphoglycerate dehydrogenase / 2-oxoglutarate reductase